MKIHLLALGLLLGFTLTLRAQDATPPMVSQVQPAPGTVTALTQITVTFSEPVTGLSIFDFLVNGRTANSITGADTTWVFTIDQPAHGTVLIHWDLNHTITDLAGNRFDEGAAGSTWQYNLVDTAPPVVATLTPAAGTAVRQLGQIEVKFNEAVAGVDAGDLLINGSAASGIASLGQGHYLFTFSQPPAGTVNVAWANNHQIRDFASPANTFGGGAWSYSLDPAAGLPDVRINELLAANAAGLRDENNEPQDWIEIHNRGASAVNLAGWSLTDDPDDPGKWIFPSTNIAPGQYLVVFASSKDRRAPTGANRLHTNFKLNPSGDYLGFFNGESPRVAMAELDFPEQRNDHSYGYDSTNALKYFSTPTPGAANGASQISGVVPPPHFNVPRGLFDSGFTLHISCDLPDATIRFTTDGVEPTAANGAVYGGPMAVSNTTVIRAIATRPHMLPSATVTHTYLFIEQVVRQPSNPAGFPTNWGFGANIPDVGPNYVFSPGSTIPGLVPADYEMDMDPLRVNPNDTNSPIDAAKLQRLKDGLRELPVVSIAMSLDDMFGTNGLHQRSADETGTPNKPQNDKPCSVEMILPDGTTAFATTCGIDLHGNASRNPTKNPKHGFKLTFRGDFGPSTLDYRLFEDSDVEEYDDVLLRADFNSSWRHWSDTAGQGLGAFQRTRATRTRDAWMKQAMRDMGGLASHSRFCHLYVNGLYWGTYDLSEDPREVFAKNNLGGTEADFDIIDQGVLKHGARTFYDAMVALPAATTQAQYEQFHQYLNVTEYVDYMLLHFFMGHQDWATEPNKNWSAIRKRVPGPEGTFRYVPWDGECILLNDNINRIGGPATPAAPNPANFPSGLHGDLDDSPEYRLLFADRVHRHMIAPDGALRREPNIARWQKWQAIMDKPIVAESVRWGDYRRDMHRSSEGVYQLYTREEFWLPENARMLTYFTNRGNIVLSQLRSNNLYPWVSAPVYNQHGGRVARNFSLSISATNPIYYTLDGSDPRQYGTSAIAAGALLYDASLTLSNSLIVKARSLFGTNWSALADATFQVAELGPTVRITEIMYNPLEGDAYEFLTVKNVGALPLNVGLYSFGGITYVFPPNTVIAPGATIVLASDNSPGNWALRYPGVTVFGYFDGSLSNGGEKISIHDPAGNVVYSLDYDDENGWDRAADGSGASLKVADALADPDDAANWYAHAPPASTVALNELMADNVSAVADGANYPDWVELHNSGGAPVSLAGWSLTDDSNPRKFVFPSGASIPAGGYVVVWCDLPPYTTPGFHTGFALGRNGETVSLFNADTQRVDAITYGLQLANYSIGRMSDGWKLNVPTPGAANSQAATAPTSMLSLNEWLANPAPGGGDDWIELYNKSSSAPVALQGIFLGAANTVHQLNSLSFIGAGGFAQLFANELPGPDRLDFKLSAAGGVIVLYDESAIEQERVTYGLQAEGVTQGRLPDGTAAITTFPGTPSPGTNNYVLNYNGPLLNEIAAINHTGPDWVELHNPNGAAFDLSGMRVLSDSSQWTFPPGTTIAGGAQLVVSLAEGLDGESDTVRLVNTNGQPVDSVVYGFQIANRTIGRSGAQWRLLETPTPGAANSLPAEMGSESLLRLNEWMADAGADNDWFEIYNGDTNAVALTGLYVSDNPSLAGQTQFQFHPLSFIGPRGFVRVIADGDPSDGQNHVNFNLSAEGESLTLLNANLQFIDGVYFGAQAEGVSEGRLPDGAPTFSAFPQTPTPEESNYIPLGDVRVNEILSAPQGPAEPAVEIYNASSFGVDLSGWYMSDHPRDHKRFRFPNATFLPAGGYLVLTAGQLGLSWAPAGGVASLSEADLAGNLSGRRSVAEFAEAEIGKTFGEVQTCAGVDFAALTSVTLGSFNAPPRVGPVVINEIMYHPPTINSNENNIDEYLELHNASAQAALLDGWQLRDAVNFSFPSNTTIPAGGYLMVVGFDPQLNPAQVPVFRAKFNVPESAVIVGPWRGNLGNGGETIALYRPSNILVERVVYDDAPPWPVSGDGDGNALQRKGALDYGNDAANWQALAPSAGRANPAAAPVPVAIVAQPVSRAVPAGTRVEFNVGVCGTPPFGYQWKRNAGDVIGAVNPSYVIPSASAGDAGTYRVAVSNWPAGAVLSAPAALIIQSPPVIDQHPQSRIVPSGTNVSFSVAATGAGPFTYQWRRNGIIIPGATGDTLELANVQVPHSGDFSVLVGNAAGAVASATANLEVFQRVRVVTHPVSRTVNTNTSVSFTVSGTGTGTLRYQWRYFGEDIPDATNQTFTINGAQLDNSGDYTVLVYDHRSGEESLPATLTVLTRPVLIRHPDNLTVPVGTNAAFQTTAIGGWPLSFRWRRGGENLVTNTLPAKQTNDTFTILNVQTHHAGRYQVGALNQSGNTLLSTNGFLTVVIPPTNVTALARTAASLDVRPFGWTRFLYQWKANGVDIVDATNSTLTVSNIQMSQAGLYSVVVTPSTNVFIAPATFSATVTVEPGPPVLSQPAKLSAGEFQFLLEGDADQTYAVQFSPDLASWTTFTNVLYTNGPVLVNDPAAGETRKFYRAFKQ